MTTTNIRKATLELYTALIQKEAHKVCLGFVQNKAKAALNNSFQFETNEKV